MELLESSEGSPMGSGDALSRSPMVTRKEGKTWKACNCYKNCFRSPRRKAWELLFIFFLFFFIFERERERTHKWGRAEREGKTDSSGTRTHEL